MTENTTTATSVIDSRGETISEGTSSTTTTTEYALEEVTKVNLLGSKKVDAIGDVKNSDTKKSISSKANGSSDFNKLVSAASDYTRSTGESINFISSNYFLSQPRDGSGSDGVGNVHAAGISAMFESKKQTYLNRSDGNTWTNRMNSFLDNIIRTTKGLNGGK